MPNIDKNTLLHGFRTNQLVLENDKLIISEKASKPVLAAARRTLNRELINRGEAVRLVDDVPRVLVERKEGGLELALTEEQFQARQNGLIIALKTINAQNKIAEKYSQFGGKTSSLGLPINPDLNVRTSDGKTFFADYRGGKITFFENQNIDVHVNREIEVWWTGLECRIRQESIDEVYGSVALIVPGSGLSKLHTFPEDREYWDMGPSGQRIVSVGVLLYRGPPMDISLTVSLVEHDSGNINAYKQKVAELISKAASGLAAMTGVSAEATAASHGFINDVSAGLVDTIASVLGADDDPYTPQTKVIHWKEFDNQDFVKNTLRRDDDARTVEYTHSMIVDGTDQGGDTGSYGFYFDVRTNFRF